MAGLYSMKDDEIERLVERMDADLESGVSLGLMDHSLRQEAKSWIALSPEQRAEVRTRRYLADEAALRRERFDTRYKKSNLEVGDMAESEVPRVLREYLPFLQGNEDPRYHAFPLPREGNFREGTLPHELLVERLDPSLHFIDELVLFVNRGGDTAYRNFARGGTGRGSYEPDLIGRVRT